MIARYMHLGLIGFLLASGVFMVIAMIPLVLLILLGIGIYMLTTRHTPRELTRRTALAPSRPRTGT